MVCMICVGHVAGREPSVLHGFRAGCISKEHNKCQEYPDNKTEHFFSRIVTFDENPETFEPCVRTISIKIDVVLIIGFLTNRHVFFFERVTLQDAIALSGGVD